jgi:hypothetical protein
MKICLVVLSIGLGATSMLQAGTLTLTATGISDGFQLTTFATIDPGTFLNQGPYGLAVAANGTVLSNNYSNNTLFVFHDVDGQTPGSAITSITPSNSFSGGYASAGGNVYGNVNQQFVQFNTNGTVNHVLTGVTQTAYFGMAGNPVNGHIISTTGQGQVIDIDPNANGGTGAATVIASPGLVYDGVTVSPDGSTAYVVENFHVIGYNLGTHAQVYDSGLLAGNPDGMGVISSNNSLNGMLVVNFNGTNLVGFVALLNTTTNALTMIASGGTRGDYVAPDPTNGSALLDYSDVVYRLSCGSGCSIGSPGATPTPTPTPGPSPTPAPATLWLTLAGLAGAGLLLSWRRLWSGRRVE